MKYFIFIFLSLFYYNINAESLSGDESRRLNSFQSLHEFEKYLGRNKVDCLDNSSGGSRGASCYDANYSAWDYELNYYYKLLRKVLNKEEKSILKRAQLSWIDYRNTTIEFNTMLLDKKYANKQGAMYIAMRERDASYAIDPIIKNRTLLIKEWYESIIKGDDE